MIRITLKRKEIVPLNLLFLKGNARLKSFSKYQQRVLFCPLEGTVCLLIAYSEARDEGFFCCCFNVMSTEFNNNILFLAIKSFVSLKVTSKKVK